MSKPKTLLLFLNARGRGSPAEFAAGDFEAMHIGLTCGAILPRSLDDHVMILLGRHTQDNYAELISKSAYNGPLSHFPRYMEVGEALLILECQDKILSFLISCAKEILHDLGAQASLTSAMPQPEPPTVSETEGGIPSLTQLTAERPYRPAAHLSFARIEAIMAAKRDACEDNLWQIREDPSHFERLALDG